MQNGGRQAKLESASGFLPGAISEIGLRADPWGWQAWCLYRADVLGIVLMQLPADRAAAQLALSSRLHDDHGLEAEHAASAASSLFEFLERLPEA